MTSFMDDPYVQIFILKTLTLTISLVWLPYRFKAPGMPKHKPDYDQSLALVRTFLALF